MEKQYYTAIEAAELIGVTRRTVYNYIDRGILKATKPAGTYKISRAEIRRFINRPASHKLNR